MSAARRYRSYSSLLTLSLDPSSVKTRIQAGAATGSPDANVSSKAKAIANDPNAVKLRNNIGLFEGVVAIARSKEGIMGLYKGFGATMLNTFSTREWQSFKVSNLLC